MFHISVELDHFYSDLLDLVNDYATTEIEALESVIDAIATSELIERGNYES